MDLEIHQYQSVRNMPSHRTLVLDRGTLKNNPKGKKDPIKEVPNPMYIEETLDVQVHVPKYQHLKRLMEQFQLVDYDIHDYDDFLEFA